MQVQTLQKSSENIKMAPNFSTGLVLKTEVIVTNAGEPGAHCVV